MEIRICRICGEEYLWDSKWDFEYANAGCCSIACEVDWYNYEEDMLNQSCDLEEWEQK